MEAALSFPGLGINPPAAEWETRVYDGYRYPTALPLPFFTPGVAVMPVVFAFAMVGDGLRDAFNPRLRGVS